MVILLFGVPTNPMEWALILGILMLLFGGSKLPQLAKALVQSKQAFLKGQREAEEETPQARTREVEQHPDKPALASVDDEELFAEALRRAKMKDVQKLN